MHESDNKSLYISGLLTRWNDLLIVVVATHDTQMEKHQKSLCRWSCSRHIRPWRKMVHDTIMCVSLQSWSSGVIILGGHRKLFCTLNHLLPSCMHAGLTWPGTGRREQTTQHGVSGRRWSQRTRCNRVYLRCCIGEIELHSDRSGSVWYARLTVECRSPRD